MTKKYIGAIDQGTTSTRFIIFDHEGNLVSSAQKEHKQIFPKPGWVEHNPLEILLRTNEVIEETLAKGNIQKTDISAVGITNQRETTVLWDRETGEPVYNAIVWQDTRTDLICKQLSEGFGENRFKDKTGLPINVYFSGSKIKWILDNIPQVREKAAAGKILFGTIESWLVWNLTGGINGGVHLTDVSNASRTLLMNIKNLKWDEEILNKFEIPKNVLPEIRSNSEEFGIIKNGMLTGVPVTGIFGDQQAALFGQACFTAGELKNTYGTGCFVLQNTGEETVFSNNGLLTTLAYKLGNQPANYALEGSIAIAGALVQWLRDNLGLIEKSEDVEKLANTVKDNGGVFIVPAFSGLFAPYWQSSARGVIVGLTGFANKGHLAKAALESTAYQSYEVFESMHKDSGLTISAVKVDGGMTVNQALMQFQADILDIPVHLPAVKETTALGAAFAAGLASGFWHDQEELSAIWKKEKIFYPKMDSAHRYLLLNQWRKAIQRSFSWVE